MMHKKIKQIIRPLIQGLSALAFNLNLSGFASGSIYTGPFKGVCVPVLNCYSCPGAVGACPIGALQSSFAAIGGKLAYYVLGMMLLFSITLGRFFCGWLCPFGAAQGLLHKAPVKKLKIPKRVDAPLRYLKYAALFVLVIGLPLLARNGEAQGLPQQAIVSMQIGRPKLPAQNYSQVQAVRRPQASPPGRSICKNKVNSC